MEYLTTLIPNQASLYRILSQAYFNVDEYKKSYDTLMKFAELMPNEDISQDLERLSNFVKI